MRPRIGINLLWLVAGDVGGTEEYSARLLEEIKEPDFDLTLFVLDGLLAAHPRLAEVGDVEVVGITGRSRATRVAAETTWLNRNARDHAFVHHLGGTMPLNQRAPGVVTVHDLQPLDSPELFSRTKARWLASMLPRSIRAAAHVMTPSSFVKSEVVERFGIDPALVHVVPSSFGPAQSGASDQSVLEQYGVDERPFVIYPAITYHHKNHITLVRALAECPPEIHLVLTGRPDAAEDELLAEIDRCGLAERVHRVGRVSSAEFESLMRNALLLAFPSRYEGFGLPVIEAMARDVPVLAADATALPEVVGDAGVLVDPDDIEAWAEAIRRIAESDGERETLIARGRQRALEFEPENCARRLVAVYDEVLASL